MKNRILLLVFAALSIVGIAVISFNKSAEHTYVPREASENASMGISGAVSYVNAMRNDLSTGTVSSAQVNKAMKDVANLSSSTSKSLNLAWEEMGPDNQGGRTRAILIDNDTTDIIYAGGVAGGLWKSITNGTSWVQLPSFDQNLAVSSIVQDKNGNIYVGTGEGFASASGGAAGSSGFVGGGIYKSTDGVNFSVIASTVPPSIGTTQNWAFINELAAHPTSGKIYAATNKGLKISSDAGTTWVSAPNILPSSNKVLDIQISEDGSVIAVIANSKLYTSNDDGVSFTQQNGFLFTGFGRVELAISPQDANYIYASCATTAGVFNGIGRSTDKGVNWTQIVPGGSATLAIFRGQGYYDNIISVVPTNKNKVLVGGVDLWAWEQGQNFTQQTLWYLDQTSPIYLHADHHAIVYNHANPNVIFSGTDGGISRSIDGGQSWSVMNKNYITTQFYKIAFGGNDMVAGGTQDNGTILIDKLGNFPMNGRDLQGGDGGGTCISHILPEAFFSTIYYAGGQRTDDAGVTFFDYFDESILSLTGTADDRVEPGSSGFPSGFVTPYYLWECVNDMNSPDTVYYVTDTLVPTGTEIIAESMIASYPLKHTLTTALFAGDSLPFKDVVQAKMFIGMTNTVWMSREPLNFNKIPEWFRIANISGTAQCIDVSQDGNHCFVGCTNGNLYRISGLSAVKDSATGFITSAQTVLTVDKIDGTWSQNVTGISVDPSDPDKVIVTLGNYGKSTYVYYANNATSSTPTWVSKQGNLPQMPVYSAVIVQHNTNTVLVGTELGMFATDNIAAPSPTWTEENTGLGQVPVYDVRQNTRNFPYVNFTKVVDDEIFSRVFPQTNNYGNIYIGTHGRGIFKCAKYLSIDEPKTDAPKKLNTVKVYPNPAVNYTNIALVLNQNAKNVSYQIYDITGKMIYTNNLGRLNSGANQEKINCSNWTSGTYFVVINVDGEKLAQKILVTK